MRVNAVGLRLNYTSLWKNKTFSSKYLITTHTNSLAIESYIKSMFDVEILGKNLIYDSIRVKQSVNGEFSLYLYIYSIEKQKKRRKKKKVLKFYQELLFSRILSNLRYIIENDLSKILQNKVHIHFILVKEKFFHASLISKYIINRLANSFKINSIMLEIRRTILREKHKRGLIVHASGRFDRKERASSIIKNYGKLSMSSVQNKISYSINEVVLKYGICGIKVWTIR